MRGIAGDSSPIRGGPLGVPPGVGSELPVPCSSSCVLVTPTPAQLMGREFFCAGIAAGPPHGPRVVDLWVNGSPNPVCYHKSPLLFSNQTASHAHLSVRTRVQSYTRGAGWGTLLPPPLSSQAKRETTGRYSFRVSPGPFSKNTALSNPHPGR